MVLLNLQCIKAPTGISPAWTYGDTANWIYKCPTLLVHLNLRMWGKLHLRLLLGTLVNIAFSCLFQIPMRYHDILCESIRYVHTIIQWYKISRSDNITKYQDKIPFTSSFTANWHQQILIIYVGIHHRDNLSNQNPNPKNSEMGASMVSIQCWLPWSRDSFCGAQTNLGHPNKPGVIL